MLPLAYSSRVGEGEETTPVEAVSQVDAGDGGSRLGPVRKTLIHRRSPERFWLHDFPYVVMTGHDTTLGPPRSLTSRSPSPLYSEMPIKEAPSLLHPTLHSTLTGTESQGVISFLGVPYATLAGRWTFASPRDNLPLNFNAVTHG